MRHPLAIAAVLASLPASLPASPQLEDLAALDARIAVLLGAASSDAGRIAQPVDRRLRLLRCDTDIAVTVGADVTVGCLSKGWRIRVPLVVARQAQASPLIIKRGDAILAVDRGRGFTVAVAATAREDGRMGDLIPIKTQTASPLLIARVRAPGIADLED